MVPKHSIQICHQAWDPQPLAFIADDFDFRGPNEKHLRGAQLTSFKHIKGVFIRWRFQKNGDNGQLIPYYCDDDNPTFCPVRAAHRIYMRARRLQIPQGVPIGVFFSKTKKKPLFITDSMVATLLQQAASAVFNIKKSSPSLKLWSTHSIRVTAANLLHRAKFADSFIQTRLRWKSTTFLMYLRNTIYSAQAHTKALSISDSNLPPHAQRCYRHKEQVEQIFSRAAAAA
jgi:hypothetical protein